MGCLQEFVTTSILFIYDCFFILNNDAKASILYLGVVAGILIGCLGIITLQSPIRSAFALIGVFVMGMVLLVTVRAEFLALMFVIVYVGAVVVFFLFVIMMVDINTVRVLNIEFVGKYIFSLFGFLGLILATSELVYTTGVYVGILKVSGGLIFCSKFGLVNSGTYPFLYGYVPLDLSNLEKLGFVLYTDFAVAFIYIGILLFIAIIGCVVVTGELKFEKSKTQSLLDQQAKGFVLNNQLCQVWVE